MDLPEGIPGIIMSLHTFGYREVTNSIPKLDKSDWLPELRAARTPVRDKRFIASVTNWDIVSYIINDHWLLRGDPELKNYVRIYQEAAPIRSAAWMKTNGRKLKIILICAMALPPIVLVINSAKKKKH